MNYRQFCPLHKVVIVDKITVCNRYFVHMKSHKPHKTPKHIFNKQRINIRRYEQLSENKLKWWKQNNGISSLDPEIDKSTSINHEESDGAVESQKNLPPEGFEKPSGSKEY